MAGVIRVVVVDDHPIVAHGTASALTAAGMDVVGIAHDIDEAVAIILDRTPDVVVCDVMLGPEPDGLDLPRRLTDVDSTTAVLLVSSYEAPFFLARAVRDGAYGYVFKSAPVPELVQAVQTIAGGGVHFPAKALRAARTHRAPSVREMEIISLVATGATNGEIARRLGITDKTVESSIAQLFARYELASRTELAMHAIREGWLASDTNILG